jgi:membrane-associated phospholipid phosphatase
MDAQHTVSRAAIEVGTDVEASSVLFKGRSVPWWVSRIASTEFPLEWSVVAALMLIDAAWAARIGFSLTVEWLDCVVPLLAVAAIITCRAIVPQERGALIAEYFILSIAATVAFAVLSYLCCTAAYHLVDDELLRLDRALGFDWQLWFRWLQGHQAVLSVLKATYDSLPYQGLYFAVLFGLLLRRIELREMFWTVFIAGLFTSAGSVLLPALGTFEMFEQTSLGDYLPDMKQLRAGSDLHFALGRLKGVVNFPSFHTTMAVVYAYAFRRTGLFGYIVIAINVTMLLSIPFIGGHYLVDMIGGAGVAVASILLARRLVVRRRSVARSAIPTVGGLARSPA